MTKSVKNVEFFNKLKGAMMEMQKNYIESNDAMILSTLSKHHIARNGMTVIKEIDFGKDFITDDDVEKCYHVMVASRKRGRSKKVEDKTNRVATPVDTRTEVRTTEAPVINHRNDELPLNDRAFHGGELAKFHTRELMDELALRGWKAKYTKVIVVER